MMPIDQTRVRDVDLQQLTVVTPYGPSGPSSRVRVFDWMAHLGLKPRVLQYLGTGDHSWRSLLRNAWQLPEVELSLRQSISSLGDRVVLMSRLATPFSNGRLESKILRTAKHGLYDFDDAIYLGNRKGLHSVFSKARTWRRAVGAADTVIAGSDILANEAQKFSDNVITIPSCVEPKHYQRKTCYQLSNEPVLVWLGSRSTEVHLKSIETALLRMNRLFNARLKLIGGAPRHLGALDAMTDRVRWSRTTFASDLARADVGISPLIDNEFARGKCAYKLLQYGASGLPVVGSPVGANATALTKLGGLAPASVDEWQSALEHVLVESEAARQLRGQQAFDAVYSNYSYATWTGAMRKCLGLD